MTSKGRKTNPEMDGGCQNPLQEKENSILIFYFNSISLIHLVNWQIHNAQTGCRFLQSTGKS